MTIVDLVTEVHDLLDEGSLAHAFGGALALAYYADPRATADVDLNVFAPHASAAGVVSLFDPVGLRPVDPPERWLPIAGVRLVRPADRAAVDLFISLDDTYAEIQTRTRSLPFGPERRLFPFLSPEDLALFKLSFGRPKDWVDLKSLCMGTPDLDVGYVERQLLAIRGPTMHPRLSRFRSMLRASHEAR